MSALQTGVLLVDILLVLLLLGVGQSNIIIRYVVLCAQADLKLRGQGDIEGEVKLLTAVEIVLALGILHGKGLADDRELMFFDVVIETVGNQLIDSLNQSLSAMYPLYQGHGSHALSESADLRIAAEPVENFLPAFCVVVLDKME